MMFRLKSLDHVVLRVTAIESCLDFYEAVLGCTVEKVHAEIGLYQLWRRWTRTLDVRQRPSRKPSRGQGASH